MKTPIGCFFIHAVLLTILVFCPCSRADWDEGGPHKMHWPQLPDLSLNGIDVKASEPYILADDFLCTEDGPVTNVHIWGSWAYDERDTNATFVLSFHDDIPSNGFPFSRPGPTLWSQMFMPADYTVRLYMGDIQEGWMNPPADYIPPGMPGSDTMCWQYNTTFKYRISSRSRRFPARSTG